MASLVWCEMKGGGGIWRDLELQSTTSVFTNAALWLGGLRCVIGLAVSAEQVGWAGVGGGRARGGVSRGGGGVGGGNEQNDGIDDEFMQRSDGSYDLFLLNFGGNVEI